MQEIEHSPFAKGQMEFQALTGAFFSFSPDSSDRPDINHSLTSWRIGWMLNDPTGTGFFRGNSELLLEGFFGKVFEGAGDYLGGATLQLRYNFVQPDARFVPYIQIGAGGFYSDIYKDQSQRLIGKSVSINLQTAIGIRYLLSDTWALSLEGGYRHVSNPGTSERNRGLDSLGMQLGFCRFF